MSNSRTFAPTEEQQQAVDLFSNGGNLIIKAGAGSGKTSTLRMLAHHARGQNRRGLYLAYNKAVQLEASRTFPPGIEARTANSLAFQAAPLTVRGRLEADRLSYSRQAEAIGLNGRSIRVLNIGVPVGEIMMAANDAVKRFCYSAADQVLPEHVVVPRALRAFREPPYKQPLVSEIVRIANLLWEDATSVHGLLRLTHDHLLKMWGLSRPTLPYDFILYDEAQDADEVVTGVVQAQPVQVVAVGDSSQAIYQWRGTVDFLARFEGQRAQLTQSWRFGEAIAEEANVWLAAIGDDMQIRGNPHRDSRVGYCRSYLPNVVLCRTNGGLISQVIRAQDRGIPVALAGKDTGRKLRDLAVAAEKLQNRQWQGHPDLQGFKTWDEVRRYADEDPAASDIAVFVKLVDAHGPQRLIAAVDGCVDPAEARLAVSTAHTAKGLEWSHVRIDEDYPQPYIDSKSQLPVYPDRQARMLAYVSVTRARDLLDPRGVEWIHQMPGMGAGPVHDDEETRAAPEPAIRTGWGRGGSAAEDTGRQFDRVVGGHVRQLERELLGDLD
jgi:hypothetical protein